MSTLNVTNITGISNVTANNWTFSNSITVGNSTVNTSVNSTAVAFSGFVPVFSPGGRLTLAANTPVMTSSYSAQTSVYYTPYVHNMIPLWNGSTFIPTPFTELSQATTDSTKSPAAVANNNNYDVFVWNDSGTLRATRGPAWSNTTNRGTGAGTTELDRINGILVNKITITNGPSAGYGTYVGTVSCNTGNAIDFYLGGSASGGDPAKLLVWNMYNRLETYATVLDNGASYTYSTASTRVARNNTNNSVRFVTGLAEDVVHAMLHSRLDVPATSGAYGYDGISIDSTSSFTLYKRLAYSSTAGYTPAESIVGGPMGKYLGYHIIYSMESGDGTNSVTHNFSSGNTLRVTLLM